MKGHRADHVIVDEAHDQPATAPDDCPVHHLPSEQQVMVHDRGSHPMATTAGEFCELWHDMASVRLALRQAYAAMQLEAEAHTRLPPAFVRPPVVPPRPAGRRNGKCPR